MAFSRKLLSTVFLRNSSQNVKNAIPKTIEAQAAQSLNVLYILNI